MANLRANRITSTEVFETTGSVQFDGSGDYLSLSDSEDFNFGSGNFTIEGWIYLIGNGTAFILGQSDSGGANSTCTATVLINSSNVLIGRVFEGSTDYGITHSVVEKNIWNHFALVRSGSTLFLYLNGVSIQTSIGSITLNNSSNEFSIGRLGQYNTQYFNGHISNLRILKGTALYTSNFTPPTRELEVIPNTVLLCCQSKTRTNQEATGKTITVNGNAVANELTPGLLTNIVKSGGSSAIIGSVEFDGTGDYLTFSGTSTDFAFGTGNFTIEGWFYRNVSATYQLLIDFRLDSSSDVAPMLYLVNGVPYLYTVGGDRINGGQSVSNNSWFHLALCRSGANTRLFLNGNQIGSTYSDSNNYVNKTNRPIIGAEGVVVGNNPFTGFISNLRIIKGTALYTSNFIPPTRKLTKLPGTVLLCCQDSNDPLTEATGKTLTGYGDLQKADGVELVTNGTFDTDVSGWTDNSGSGSSISWSSGRMYMDGSAAYAKADQQITTVAGKTYIFSAQVSEQNASEYSELWVGTAVNTANLARKYSPTGYNGIITVVFTATTTTTWIRLYSGWVVYFDNVSVTLYDPPNRASDFTPSVGSDGSVEFAGPTTINTENYFYLPTGPTEQRSRGRGVFGGGNTGTGLTNTIQFIQIQSQGNSQDFGDLSSSAMYIGSCSSSTRGLFGGAYISPTYSNTIEYITISTSSKIIDFGDLTRSTRGLASCSSPTRGLFGGGVVLPGNTINNIIDYITIASIGNAIDFGDLTQSRGFLASSSSSIRGIFGGGWTAPSTVVNTIDYVTIASIGNAIDFGDLTQSRGFLASSSSSTRSLFGGGYTPSRVNTIDYITIASTGNAVDFGDLIQPRGELTSCSSNIRGVFGGGYTTTPSATRVNTIDYVIIASTGNAQDFGDLLEINYGLTGCSDSHGGLQ